MFFKKTVLTLMAAIVCLSMTQVTAQEKNQAGEPSPLVKKVIESLQKQEKPDFDKAISELETGLKANPHDKEAQLLLVQIIETSGMRAAQEDEKKASPYFLKAATVLRSMMKSDKLEGDQQKYIAEMVFYNEACVLAKSGKADAAMAALKDCFNAGVDNISMLATDGDLDSLRNRDDFKTMVKELTVRAAEEAKKEFAEMIANQRSFPFDFELKNLDG
ncbi:MAG: hypothetical protein RJA81_927, partial [Planctomycetota bacterium]